MGSQTAVVVSNIELFLHRISRSPLKSQQRLRILKRYLLPKFTHQCVLGRSDTKILRKLDCTIRKYVRKRLRLPHDVPVAFFYAPVKDGGLGIDLLEVTIPTLKYRSLMKLGQCQSVALRGLFEGDFIQTQLHLLQRVIQRHCNDDSRVAYRTAIVEEALLLLHGLIRTHEL